MMRGSLLGSHGVSAVFAPCVFSGSRGLPDGELGKVSVSVYRLAPIVRHAPRGGPGLARVTREGGPEVKTPRDGTIRPSVSDRLLPFASQ